MEKLIILLTSCLIVAQLNTSATAQGPDEELAVVDKEFSDALDKYRKILVECEKKIETKNEIMWKIKVMDDLRKFADLQKEVDGASDHKSVFEASDRVRQLSKLFNELVPTLQRMNYEKSKRDARRRENVAASKKPQPTKQQTIQAVARALENAGFSEEAISDVKKTLAKESPKK